MNDDQYGYEGEELMGQWITARCEERYKQTHEKMPADILAWLRTAGSNSPADGTSKPPREVLGWMVKTVIDPDWDQ